MSVEKPYQSSPEEMKKTEEMMTDNRLSNEEALLYQEYATKNEGKEFSAQASIEAYKEAQELIDKLQDSQFDWLGIEWDKIDFENTKHIMDLEKRLDEAARSIIESQGEAQNKNEEEISSNSILKKIIKGVTIPLVLSAAILVGCSAKQETDSERGKRIKENQQLEENQRLDRLQRFVQESTKEVQVTLRDGRKLNCLYLEYVHGEGSGGAYALSGLSCDWNK